MKQVTKAIGLNSLVDGLLFSLQAEGKTPRTREYYSKLLRHFLDYAKGRGWNDVRSLDVQRAREFLAWTASRTMNTLPATVPE